MADDGMIARRDRSDREGERSAAGGLLGKAGPRAGGATPWASPGAGDVTPTGVRLDRARNGDRSALGRLLQEERPWLVRQARRHLPRGIVHSPSELVQGAYLGAIKGIGGFHNRDKPSFRAWLKK